MLRRTQTSLPNRIWQPGVFCDLLYVLRPKYGILFTYFKLLVGPFGIGTDDKHCYSTRLPVTAYLNYKSKFNIVCYYIVDTFYKILQNLAHKYGAALPCTRIVLL